MSETGALLAAVLDDPEDLAIRRVYADALIAAGAPRGELINVQCNLAERTPADAGWRELVVRERDLLGKHGKAWTAPYKSFLHRPTFERGMIEKAFVHAKKFVPAAGVLLEREPVMALGMRGLTRVGATTLGLRPELARLRKLRVAESAFDERTTASLFTERLARLRELDLYQSSIDDAGLAHLAGTLLPQLEHLDITGTEITYDGLEQLVCDPRAARLGHLALRWLVPGTDGAGFLAEHLALPSLTHLDVGCSHYQDGDLVTLAGNACFRQLRGLSLEQNEVSGTRLVDALSALSQLESLDLSTNSIEVDTIVALAATQLPLQKLRLYQCGVRDEHLIALAAGAFPLRQLDLGYGMVRAPGLEAIGRTAWPLEKLELWACKIGDDGVRALANARFTRTLRELVLGYNYFGDDGAIALAAGDWSRLERIVFRGDAIGEAGARALAASTTMPALRSIVLEDMTTPKSALAPLRKRGVAIEM